MRRTHAASGDCEAVRPGLIGQPANTLSSAALLPVAAGIWRRASAARDRRWQVVAVGTALAGVGSIGYHGPGGRIGAALHDLGLGVLAVGATAAVVRRATALPADPPPLGRAGPRVAAGPPPSAWIGVAAAAVHATSRTGGPLCRPRSLLQGHAAWHLLGAAALAVAAREALPPVGA